MSSLGRPGTAVLVLGALFALVLWSPWAGAVANPGSGAVQQDAAKGGAPQAKEASRKASSPKDSPNPRPARPVTDYDLILADYQTSGALKFYDLTEDLLRAGQFERAFCRYLFLKTQIRGQALYAGLTPMVDQRLHFLRAQMRLGEEAVPPVIRPPAKRYKKPRPAKKPPLASGAAPPENQGGASVTQSSASQTPGLSPTGQPPASMTASGGPAGEAPSPNPKADQGETPPKADQESPPEEEKEKPPPPPPSFWEKTKKKLMFWKKT